MKKHNIYWKDVIMGALAASVFWLFIYAVAVAPKNISNSTTSVVKEESTANTEDQEVVEETIKAYNTNIQSSEFTWENGDHLELHTPENFYSLTDQYIDSLSQYYNVDVENDEQIFVVGDSIDSANCSVMINAASVSKAEEILNKVYAEEENMDNILSEVYTYLKTGELPEDLPDDYYLCDYGTVTVDGVAYHLYDKSYSISYSYYEEEDTAQIDPKTMTVPNHEFVAYSDTEDAVEIITFLVDYDVENAYKYLCEFIGAENSELPEGNVVYGELPSVEESNAESEELINE